MQGDFYEILGVERSATEDEIKRAYRKKAKECHPDANMSDPDAERRFKELSEAYSILSNPEKRQRYDTFGSTNRSSGGYGGFETIDLSDALRMFMEAMGGMNPMAEAFFGRGFSRGRHSRSRRGEDLRVLVSVSLEEVLRGTKREIKISHKVVCKECGGSGTPSGAKEISCPGCQGRGQRRTVRSTLFGTLQTISTCPECGGTGTKITAQCGKCSGEGRLDATETIEIEIPPGVSDGGGFVIEDKGNAGIAGGTHGNLVVFIKETPHKVFSRNAGELHYRLPITFSQAALGDIIEIPTLDGKIHQLKIPEGTQFGQNFRLRGMGLPSVESRSRGDLVVTTFIITPQKLSKDEKEYFEKLKEIEKGKPVELPNPDENILEKLWELFNK